MSENTQNNPQKCPFNNAECTKECALFIAPEDLNELVSARLTSIGVYDREKGLCSLKSLALSGSRFMFERTSSSGRI